VTRVIARSLKSVLMVSLLVAVGCSGMSKKKSKGQDGGPNLEGSNDAISLELNGDSDSNKAGQLKTIYFAYDSSAISSDSRETLKANAEFLKANTTVTVQVEGHCDERGSVQYNLALGERRAKSVREFLVASGIAKNRVTVISFGKERAVAFGHDEEAWSKNRRGNFVVTAK
jgi:peptidoglycan-associated lipoprotein